MAEVKHDYAGSQIDNAEEVVREDYCILSPSHALTCDPIRNDTDTTPITYMILSEDRHRDYRRRASDASRHGDAPGTWPYGHRTISSRNQQDETAFFFSNRTILPARYNAYGDTADTMPSGFLTEVSASSLNRLRLADLCRRATQTHWTRMEQRIDSSRCKGTARNRRQACFTSKLLQHEAGNIASSPLIGSNMRT
jgi:hypothetical protein